MKLAKACQPLHSLIQTLSYSFFGARHRTTASCPTGAGLQSSRIRSRRPGKQLLQLGSGCAYRSTRPAAWGCLERVRKGGKKRARIARGKKTGGHWIASFRKLWAMQSKPHSISTFFKPLSINLRNSMLCLISPKTVSGSVLRCCRKAMPCSESRFS